MKDSERHLSLRTAGIWAISICGFTGALGVFSGFAIFILLRPSTGNDPLTFWLGLAAAVFAAFIVEVLRDTLRGEVLDFSSAARIAQIVVTLVTLAAFELFVFATHHAMDIVSHPAELQELREAVLGPVLQGTEGSTR